MPAADTTYYAHWIEANCISFDKTSTTIDLSNDIKTDTLTATVDPNSGSIIIGVRFTSDNTSIATVATSFSKDKAIATIVGKANGTAVITEKKANGKTTTCTVTVQTSPTSISINKTSAMLNASDDGKQVQLSVVSYTPSTANVNKGVTWTSSNTDVITVSTSGLVTAVASGTATITATTANGKKATCDITADLKLPTVTLSKNGGNYTITTGNTTVSVSQKLTATDTGGSTLDVLKYQYSTSTTVPSTSDSNWKIFTSGTEFTESLGGRTYYLYTYVTDKAGNRATRVQKSNAFVIKYEVKYNANGGSGAPESQQKVKGTDLTLSSTEPTRTGYTFAGWTTNSDGTDDGYNWTNWTGTWKYVNGQYGISDGKLELYAIWEKKLTLTLNYNNGHTDKITVSVYNSENSVEITLPTSVSTSPTGYEFQCWNANSNGTGVDYKGGTEITISDNTTVYAKYKLSNPAVKVITSTYETYYSSLNEAIAASTNGSTVTLLKNDVETTKSTLAKGKIITLDLDGYDLSTVIGTNLINVNGTLNVEGDGSVKNTSSSGVYLVESTGTLNITSGTHSAFQSTIDSSGGVNVSGGDIIASGTSTSCHAINSTNKLNISGGNVSASNGATPVYTSGGTYTMTGGTVKDNYTAEYKGDEGPAALYCSNTTVTLTNATITSESHIAVELGNCTSVINSGTNITGDYRGVNKSNGGTLTINSGVKIIVENFAYNAASSEISSAGIWSSENDSGKKYIYGGTIANLAKSGSNIYGIFINNDLVNLYLGKDDGTINTSYPTIMALKYAVIINESGSNMVYWYDGRMCSITSKNYNDFVYKTSKINQLANSDIKSDSYSLSYKGTNYGEVSYYLKEKTSN